MKMFLLVFIFPYSSDHINFFLGGGGGGGGGGGVSRGAGMVGFTINNILHICVTD